MYTILRHRGCDSQVLLPDSYSSVHYGTSRESNVTRGPLAAGLSFRPISAITLSAPRWSAGKKIEDEKKKLRKRRKERFRCLRGCSEDSVLLSRTLFVGPYSYQTLIYVSLILPSIDNALVQL